MVWEYRGVISIRFYFSRAKEFQKKAIRALDIRRKTGVIIIGYKA